LSNCTWQGHVVELHLRVGRFRCTTAACPQRICAERRPAATLPGKRRTTRLSEVQRNLALAQGGESGSRLAARLAMPVSGDTLVRLIRAVPIEDTPAPRVIGRDDWAWRRGRRYGTIIVDLERQNRPIDLLADRQAETVAAWLKAHPGVQIAVRDRAGSYAEGVRAGAPEAVQVADRWHLLRNLGDAVHAAARLHHAAARRVAQEVMAQPPRAGTPGEVTAEPTTAAQRRGTASHARRQAQLEEAARLRAAGASLAAIARRLGLDRKTLRHWLRAGAVPTWHKPRRGGLLDPHLGHLGRRWGEGCHNAARLWRELTALGFPGRPAAVRA
jgi:transposase